MELMRVHPEPDDLRAYLSGRMKALTRARNYEAATAMLDITSRIDEINRSTVN